MPTPRRLIALTFLSLAALCGQAQPAPAAAGAEPLTLNEAVQRALAKNFTIKVEGYDAAIASARVTEALGKFDPNITANYHYSDSFNPVLADPVTGLRAEPSYTKTDDYDVGLGGVLPWGMTYRLGTSTTNTRGTFNAYADNYSTFTGIQGTQPLLRDFGFGPTLASIRVAQVSRGISEWAFRQAVMNTVTGVIFAYHELNFAHAYYRSAVRARELALGLLAENEKRFKVGSMSEYEVISARSEVAGREEGILSAERQVREAENALKQLISDDRTPALLDRHFSIEPPPPAPIVVVDAAADFRLALEQRPDYQQARLSLKREGINRRLQRNQLLPSVDLVGRYGYNGYDADLHTSRRQVRNEDYHAYSWGLVVSVPLTFTTERGRYRAARLAERQAATDLERIEQNIVVRVGNAAGQIETTQKRVQVTRQARELAQYTLDSEFKRLRAGTGSTFVVSRYQEALSRAEVSEARAQADYALALAEYDRQLGVTLAKLDINIDPPK